MPDFTPEKADVVAYATIVSAQASSSQDVERYLIIMKKDLSIGHTGYPKRCVVVGDQQTYSIMKNLKIKVSQHLNGFPPCQGIGIF